MGLVQEMAIAANGVAEALAALAHHSEVRDGELASFKAQLSKNLYQVSVVVEMLQGAISAVESEFAKTRANHSAKLAVATHQVRKARKQANINQETDSTSF